MSATAPQLDALWGRLHEAREALVGLRLTAVEDQPAAGATLVAERLADELEAACAETQAAVDALDRLRAGGRVDALADCHRHLQTAASLQWLALGPPQRHRDVQRLAQRGEEWRAWSRVLWSAAERAREPLAAALEALPDAWLAVADHATPAVHVHTTAVGQQLLAAPTKETP